MTSLPTWPATAIGHGRPDEAGRSSPRPEVPSVRVVTILRGSSRKFMIPRTKYFPQPPASATYASQDGGEDGASEAQLAAADGWPRVVVGAIPRSES